MSEDWSLDVRKYAPDADQSVIDAIVRHCGVALQRRESALVSFTEPTELATVRESFLKKKLGLTLPDSELDAGIARVGERMRGDSTRNRVTVYYLLAEHFRKLSVFGGRDEIRAASGPTAMHAGAAGVAASAVASMPERPAERPTVTPEPRAQAFSDRPAAAVAAPRPGSLMRWLPWLVLGALALLLLWWLAQRTPRPVATAPAPAPAAQAPARPEAPATAMTPAAPATTTPAAPAAAVAVAGFPARIFFATDSAAIGPEGSQEIQQAAAAAKNSGHKVAITGFTDRTGDQTHNEELAKNRAVAVRDALVTAGVPAADIEMRPPMMVETGAAGRDADARRVEISAR